MRKDHSMSRKNWITKKDISDIIKAYSVRTNEFEQVGNEGYFFKSNYTKDYTISLGPEIQYGNIKTGRIVVSHTKNGGKRTFQDIWERDPDDRLQFVFRNPWDKPFADYDYIKNLEAQILGLKESGHKLQEQSERYQGASADIEHTQGYTERLLQENISLRHENKALRDQIAALTEKNNRLLDNTKHNARGAGRKADPQHLESQIKEVRSLLEDGKTATEIQKIMGISRSSFFRYKRFIQEPQYKE